MNATQSSAILSIKRANKCRRLLASTLAEHRNRHSHTIKGMRATVTLPPFAWPGGYTIIYYDKSNSILCTDCATKSLRDPDNYSQYNTYHSDAPIAYDTYDEGPTLYCDGCNAPLPSAYGDPDTDDHGIPFEPDSEAALLYEADHA